MKKVNNKYMDFEDYKKNNKEYLIQTQKFFDFVDNIQDEKLKKNIVYQKLKCDEVLEKLLFKYLNK